MRKRSSSTARAFRPSSAQRSTTRTTPRNPACERLRTHGPHDGGGAGGRIQSRPMIVRSILTLLLVVLQATSARAFGFDDVATLARSAAERAHRSTHPPPPRELCDLTYDQYRDIRFRPDHALWRAEHLPFEAMF